MHGAEGRVGPMHISPLALGSHLLAPIRSGHHFLPIHFLWALPITK
jgi:hypothetical protein